MSPTCLLVLRHCFSFYCLGIGLSTSLVRCGSSWSGGRTEREAAAATSARPTHRARAAVQGLEPTGVPNRRPLIDWTTGATGWWEMASSTGVVAFSGRPIRSADVVVRRELLRGLGRLNATSTVLQRARLADPLGGMWEAADVQWWWRRPRATDELALSVWFDEVGPVAAAGLTAWDDTWQADVFVLPSIVKEEDVWAATLEATAGHRGEALRLLVHEDDALLTDLAIRSGFAMTDELSGTAWMDADHHPPVAQVDGFAIVDRVVRADRPHPMIARNGELVERRLRQCSLYDPTLDLAVEDADGRVAGYALFWFDHTTLVGLLEPMRVEDEYQRRGLARMLLTNGLDRLARKGARRLKVGFGTDVARSLYLSAGFVQTSIDRLLIRPARREQ